MAAKKRTWLWIVLGVVGVGTLSIIALAVAGFYFVSKRFEATRASAPEAQASLDHVVATLGGRPALYAMDEHNQPQLTTPLDTLPTSTTKISNLWLYAWTPHEGRTIRLSLPLWVLKLGDQKVRIVEDDSGFSLDELDIDIAELERIGPALIIDHKGEDGERILLWTQ